MTATAATGRRFTIVRRLPAPREAVFRAWTDPEHLTWFENPGHATTVPTTVDLTVGGAWRVEMVEHPGKRYVTGGVYREIVPGERIVFSWGAVGGWPALDLERLDDNPVVTVDLRDVEGGTEMVVLVAMADHLTEDEVRGWLDTGMATGWRVTLDRLEAALGRPGAA